MQFLIVIFALVAASASAWSPAVARRIGEFLQQQLPNNPSFFHS